MSARILVLEDDPALNENIAQALAGAGYEVLSAHTRADAERLVRAQSIDLALCDVNLPASDSGSASPEGDGDGFGFCRWLKARRDVRLCFLSARDLEEDVLAGYDLGADDYVTKPFSMKVLLAKIAVLLGRNETAAVLDDGWLRIDLALALVTCAGDTVRLSPTEWKLLRLFLDHRGQLLTYSVLLDALWAEGVEMTDKHALAVAMNRLRKKLEDDGHSYIANVYGMGYLWK